MVCVHQATIHYQIQCGHRSMSPYGLMKLIGVHSRCLYKTVVTLSMDAHDRHHRYNHYLACVFTDNNQLFLLCTVNGHWLVMQYVHHNNRRFNCVQKIWYGTNNKPVYRLWLSILRYNDWFYAKGKVDCSVDRFNCDKLRNLFWWIVIF